MIVVRYFFDKTLKVSPVNYFRGLFSPQGFDRGHSCWLRRKRAKVEAAELLDDPRHLRVFVAAQIGPESGKASGWDPFLLLFSPFCLNFILVMGLSELVKLKMNCTI